MLATEFSIKRFRSILFTLVGSMAPDRFEPTTGDVEWHRVASVNVSKLESEGDVQTLKQFLPEIAVGKVCRSWRGQGLGSGRLKK